MNDLRDMTDSGQLRAQYGDAHNLDARIALHARYSTNPYGFHRWVLDQLGLPAGARVLDVGCGSARLWRENAGRLPAGWRVALADLSPGMLRDARLAVGAAPAAFELINANVEALPFASGAFDAVIANHMLYHVSDRPRAYAEIRRVLRPQGVLAAATNGRHTMREYDELVARFRPAGDPAAPRSFQSDDSFSLESGGAELERHFGSVELRRYDDSLAVPAAGPLVAYAASTGRMTGGQLAALAGYLESHIAAHGPFKIGKDVGLFLASRGAE